MTLRVRFSGAIARPNLRLKDVPSLSSHQGQRRSVPRLPPRPRAEQTVFSGSRALSKELASRYSTDASYDSGDPEREAPIRRVLLKISGEALKGPKGCGIDAEVLQSVAKEIASSSKEVGIQIAVVIGGGNFFRGTDAFDGLDRATADYVGMLATTMNAVCLQSVLETFGVETRLQTAIEIREVAEPFIRRKAIRHLEKGRVVIFGAGTGNPFFTTDMAAALRAAEINAQEVLKATKVDGVFSSDPEKDPGAERLECLTYDHALAAGLQFMDNTALTICRNQRIPIRIFNIKTPGNITKAIRGVPVGSIMQSDNSAAQSNGSRPCDVLSPTTLENRISVPSV